MQVTIVRWKPTLALPVRAVKAGGAHFKLASRFVFLAKIEIAHFQILQLGRHGELHKSPPVGLVCFANQTLRLTVCDQLTLGVLNSRMETPIAVGVIAAVQTDTASQSNLLASSTVAVQLFSIRHGCKMDMDEL